MLSDGLDGGLDDVLDERGDRGMLAEVVLVLGGGVGVGPENGVQERAKTGCAKIPF